MFFYVILGDQFFEALVFIYRNRRIRNKETTSLPPEGSRRKGGTNVHRSDGRGGKRAPGGVCDRQIRRIIWKDTRSVEEKMKKDQIEINYLIGKNGKISKQEFELVKK